MAKGVEVHFEDHRESRDLGRLEARRVVAVGVAGGDHQQPEANTSATVCTVPPGARGSSDAGGKAVGHFQSLLDLTQDQQPTVGREPAPVKAGDQSLCPRPVTDQAMAG